MATKPGNGYVSPFGDGTGKVDQKTERGSDFTNTANANGQAVRGGNRDFSKESRTQSTETEGGEQSADGVPEFRPEREQTATSFSERTNPRDRALDGKATPDATASAARRGTGSIGNPHKPFRVK